MSQYEKWLRCFWRWYLEALDKGDKVKAKVMAKNIRTMKDRGY